jgi:ABC-2 type transport system permease protein
VTVFAALLRRELAGYFVSPVAYIVLTVMLFISGMAFAGSMEGFAEQRAPIDFNFTLSWISVVVVATGSFVTMRLVAEEKSRGTLEIALTAPVGETAFILAKFFAAVVLLAWILLLTSGYVLVAARYGQIDPGAVFCGYLGVLLCGAVTYAAGLFVSSLCTSQITAGIVGFTLAVILLVAGYFGPRAVQDAWWRNFLLSISLFEHFGDFLKGVVDTGRLVTMLSLCAVFLFLAVRVVESRRWR